MASPELMRDAACIGTDLDLWFPPKGGRARIGAYRICAMCPVFDECLAETMRIEAETGHASRHGIFAGTTPNQRVRLTYSEPQRWPELAREALARNLTTGGTDTSAFSGHFPTGIVALRIHYIEGRDEMTACHRFRLLDVQEDNTSGDWSAITCRYCLKRRPPT